MTAVERYTLTMKLASTYPYSATRHLTPPPATIEAYSDFKKRLGITKSVLTHGLSYGDDCTSLKAFIPRLGAAATAGIGVVDPATVTNEELLKMHSCGVRGVRINLYHYNAMEDVEAQKRALLSHATRLSVASLSWSITMTTVRTEFWEELQPFIHTKMTRYGLHLVSDHFCLLKGPSMLPAEYRGDPTSQPGFKAIMGLVQDGHLWVKLSAPYRVSESAPDYSDLKYLVRAFVGANKHRVLWGSDWPHTPRMKVRSVADAMKESPYLEIDDQRWLLSLKSWLSAEEWNLVMIENPGILFKQ
jgi:predicted TIM-barrel fold metal-dependent hydrolase